MFSIAMLRGRLVAAQEIGPIARRHCVDGQQLADWLVGMTWEPPPTARVYSERAVSLELCGVTIGGTADLILDDEDADLIEVIDLKSGSADYAEADHFWQLAFYALAAAREFGRSRARASLYYIELGDSGWAHQELELAEVENHLEEIISAAMAQIDKPEQERRYRTGSACAFCPARFSCPARTVELRTFAALAPSHTWEITAENAAQVLERARAIERVTAAAKDAVKEYVRAHGPVPAGDGKELRIVNVHRKAYTVAESDSEQLRAVKI